MKVGAYGCSRTHFLLLPCGPRLAASYRSAAATSVFLSAIYSLKLNQRTFISQISTECATHPANSDFKLIGRLPRVAQRKLPLSTSQNLQSADVQKFSCRTYMHAKKWWETEL